MSAVCLKLLPVEAIKALSFPSAKNDDVIKHLHYLSYDDRDPALVGDSEGQSLAFQPNRSLNTFTGNLSALTRSASYKVCVAPRETAGIL